MCDARWGTFLKVRFAATSHLRYWKRNAMIIVTYVFCTGVVVGAVGVGCTAVLVEFTGRAGAHEASACLGAWVAVITGHVVHDQVAV